jgi:hypothetical protein
VKKPKNNKIKQEELCTVPTPWSMIRKVF